MDLFHKIFLWNASQAKDAIVTTYDEKWWGVVNYIYFANLIKSAILWGKNKDHSYISALENGDFLLPDGIALYKYYKKYFGKELSNLNGTDFLPYFLENIERKYCLICYGAQKEVIETAMKQISYPVVYFQDGYRVFEWEKLEKIISENSHKIPILLVWLWTPLQEKWIEKNLENIKKYHLLVFSQWGTFDFWAGKDKRAPKWVQNMHLERLWRVILNPKKNFKKVWYSLYLFWYLVKKEK